MADVTSKVAIIRNATYGNEVREGIASGIENINTEVVSTTGKQEVLETVFNGLVINAGSDNAEIVVARGIEDSLPIRLNKFDSSLAETTQNIANNNTAILAIDRGIGGTKTDLATIQALPPDTLRYINGATGLWYYHNGTSWVSGGTFQGIGIADSSVTTKMIESSVASSNLNTSALEYGAMGTTGNLIPSTGFIRSKDYVSLLPNTQYFLEDDNGYIYRMTEYTASDVFIKVSENVSIFTTSATTAKIKYNTSAVTDQNSLLTKIRLNAGAVALTYETPNKKIPWELIKNNKMPSSMASSDNCYLSCITGRLNINFRNNQVIIPSGAKYIFYGNKYFSLPTTEIIIEKIALASALSGILAFNESTGLLRMCESSNLTDNDSKLGVIYKGNIILNTSFYVNGKALKTFVAFGDSITWYDGKPYGSATTEVGVIARGYETFIREELGYNVVNKGYSGYDMTQINTIIQSYDFTGVDEVSITSGANDHRKGIIPGTVLPIGSAFNTSTYSGAMQASIEKIINYSHDIKIYLITPVRGWFNENLTVDVPNAYNSEMEISEEYVNVMKSIGKLYGIPTCDVFNAIELNVLTRPTLLVDVETLPYYLHPSTKGFKRYKKILIPFLNNN